ncbi:MAG: hypothetical protein K9J17_16450 [Flavobacteriales bacterium]|nr:hypothetical protein [Flavobacteriales bacterium]
MKPKLRYVELKTGYSDNGPAWIGLAEFSKSGQTVYFNGQAFRNIGGSGVAGNFIDVETSDEYWISAIKKDGNDRHWAGAGKVKIDRNVIDFYQSLVGTDWLNSSQFELIDILPTDKQKFSEIENRTMN